MSIDPLLVKRALWTFEPKLAWATGSLCFVTAWVLFTVQPQQELCIRWWGMLLQLLGIVSVIHEFRSTQKHFGQDSAYTRMRKWLARWPTRNVTVKIEGVCVSPQTGNMAATGGHVGPRPGTDIGSRVVALEQGFSDVMAGLTTIRSAADTDRRAHVQAMEHEGVMRAQADASLTREIEAVTTGSLPFSMFGVAWLTVGMIIGTISPELAKWSKIWLQ